MKNKNKHYDKDIKKPKNRFSTTILAIIFGFVLCFLFVTALGIDFERNNPLPEPQHVLDYSQLVFMKPIDCDNSCQDIENFVTEYSEKLKLNLNIVNADGRPIGLFYVKEGELSQIMPTEEKINAMNFMCGLTKDEEICQMLETELTPDQQEVPKIELFVMSHCPYGVQMEKTILPVKTLLGDKIDFKIKYVNYVMYGVTEIKEQMRQYCMQEQQPDQFIEYMNCFVDNGNAQYCLSLVEANLSEMNVCFQDLEERYHLITDVSNKGTYRFDMYPDFEIYDEEVTNYGIEGSPALVVNGKVVTVERSPQAVLDLICNSFVSKPTECDIQISSEITSSGFGEDISENEESVNFS